MWLKLQPNVKVGLSIFDITFRILIILIEHIEPKNSLELKLQIDSTFSIRIIHGLEAIASQKMLNPM